jgi:hypothetical protein
MTVERNVAYRLQRVGQEIGPLEASWESYNTPARAKVAEHLLLAKCEADHVEFPPLNRLESGKTQRMVEEWLKLAPGQSQNLLEILARIRSGEIEPNRSAAGANKEDT